MKLCGFTDESMTCYKIIVNIYSASGKMEYDAHHKIQNTNSIGNQIEYQKTNKIGKKFGLDYDSWISFYLRKCHEFSCEHFEKIQCEWKKMQVIHSK